MGFPQPDLLPLFPSSSYEPAALRCGETVAAKRAWVCATPLGILLKIPNPLPVQLQRSLARRLTLAPIVMMAAVSMGTVFSSYLHFARAATAEIEHKPGEHIVDDELTVRNVPTGLLQSLGYRVRECAGGADVLQVLCCWPRTFDAVTSEFSMPGMSGLDLAAMVHGLRPDLTLILGSGYGAAVGREKLTDRALRGLDSKACSMQGFGEALNRALMRSGALE